MQTNSSPKKRRLDDKPDDKDGKTDDAIDMRSFQRSLPVFQYKKQLVQALVSQADNKVIIIVAETGSGKSTQIPAYALQAKTAKHLRIAVTQPRRVAAMTLAQRVAHEQKQRLAVKQGDKSNTTISSPISHLIGYRVRFEDTTTHETRLVYVTVRPV